MILVFDSVHIAESLKLIKFNEIKLFYTRNILTLRLCGGTSLSYHR